jgi:carboxyl-terminal processing protease
MTARIGRYILFAFAIWFAAPAQTASAAQLQCAHLPQLFDNYLRFHYTQRELTADIKERAVEQYIKSLDPSKTLFLQGDIAQLRQDLKATFATMGRKDCSLLKDVRAVALKRAEENEAYAKKLLNGAFKLDKTVAIVIDPDKRTYAVTPKEKEEYLRKMVHFQMANYLNSGTKLEEAKKLLSHRYELVTKRISERNQERMLADFTEAFASALDPHSSFLSSDRLKDFQISMQLSLEGIGATLTSMDGFTIIESLIAGGGAERSKMLRPKDKILAVAQEGQEPVSVIDMELSDVVKMIRGKKGTKVSLTIFRQDDNKTFDVTIIRDKIDVKDQAASIKYETRQVGDKKLKIGVIDLPSFYGGGPEDTRSSLTDVRNLLIEAKKEKVDGIVLDLSRNGGGLLDHAVKISGLFIKEGGVVATRDTRGKVQYLADEDDEVVYNGPLVVLVSRMSASASEILAGSLQAYKRALVVGSDHTFGKGTVQSVVDLPYELGAMKVTVGMFFVAGGASTQHNGVASDIRFPSPFGEEDIGEKSLDYSLPPQTIKPFLSASANDKKPDVRWTPIEPAMLKSLAEKSQARVSADPKFAEIVKKNEEAKANKGIVSLSDLDKKAEDKKDDNKSIRDEIKEIIAPLINESVNITADLITAQQS